MTVADGKRVDETGWLENATKNAASWRGEILRLALIGLIAAVFALTTNYLRERPVPIWSATGPAAWRDAAERISCNDLKPLLKGTMKIFLLDVRSPQLFQQAHPAGAFNAPAHDFMDYYATVAPYLDVADLIVVVCNDKDCSLGDLVAHILIKDLKHERVRVLYGGWEAYKEADLPREGEAP
jgi:rhodanese-related sulfurtransferase